MSPVAYDSSLIRLLQRYIADELTSAVV